MFATVSKMNTNFFWTIFWVTQSTPVQQLHISDMDSLFTHQTSQNKYLRPRLNYSEASDVILQFSLVNLKDIDAVEGTMAVSGYFIVRWEADNMKWNPYDFNLATVISIPYDKIWIPPLINSNSAGEFTRFGMPGEYVQVYYNGLVVWYPGVNLKFNCDIDTTHFPFDTQICSFEVITWGFPTEEIHLLHGSSELFTTYYNENSEWSLVNTSTLFLDGEVPKLKFQLYCTRQSTFAVVTLIFPVFLLSLLNIFVFLLPQDSGERIGFSLTMLLSIIIFMTIAQGILPATAKPRLSGICILLLGDIIMSGLITAAVVVSSWIYYKSKDEPIPNWLQSVVKVTRHCPRNQNKVQTLSSQSTSNIKRMADQVDSFHKSEEGKITWMTVARYWDNLSMVFFFVCLISLTLGFVIDSFFGKTAK